MRGPFVLVLLAGCPSPRSPSGPAAAPVTVEVGGPLRGVAGDGHSLFAAIGDHVTARGARTWSVQLAGTGGPLATGNGLVYAAASAKLRGDPAAIVSALDAASGAERWKLPIDSTGWSVITALAATSDGVLAAGSFQGTLRAGDSVVGSAGETDGFVARVTADGKVAWLVRMGGPGSDAIQGAAISGDRIAIAGTFAAGSGSPSSMRAAHACGRRPTAASSTTRSQAVRSTARITSWSPAPRATSSTSAPRS